jgi:hypothetical protein
MGDDINWLVTVLYGDTLLRCALKVKQADLPGDCAEYPMEPENRKAIHALLPMHVQSCGPVGAVEELFEVRTVNGEDYTAMKNENDALRDAIEALHECVDGTGRRSDTDVAELLNGAMKIPRANAPDQARVLPSPEAGCSARGCHNCGHGHLGGWKTYRHWPCLTCRIGSGLCCGDDNWKPNSVICASPAKEPRQ